MPSIQIVCANCGAKYKLPETFKSDSAKCKACGGVIDVKAQLAGATPVAVPTPAAAKPAAAKPAAATPAAAKPAVAKPATAKPAAATSGAATSAARASAAASPAAGKSASDRGGASRREKPARGERRGRRKAADDAGDAAAGEATGGRRGGRGRQAGGNKTPMWVGAGALVAIAAIVGTIFALKGDDQPDGTDTASAPAASAPAATNAPATTPSKDGATPGTPAATDPSAADDAVSPTHGDSEVAPVEAAASSAASTADTQKPKPRAVAGRELKTRADVFDPKTETQPLPWPDYVTEAQRTEVLELLAEVRDGGLAGTRAKNKLEQIGHAALAGIINELRNVDYFDATQSMHAYEINRLLEAMAVGINAGYRPPVLGEEVPLEDAHNNALAARTWQHLLEKHPTPEDFDKLRKTRQTRNETDK